MSEDSVHHDGQSHHQPDSQEKQVAAMAVRLPILIIVAVLLMLGAGLLAMYMHGG